MHKNKYAMSIEYWLYTLRALGVDFADLVKSIMDEGSVDETDESTFAQEEYGEQVDYNNLVSSSGKQKKYVTYGYVNDVYTEYQILCTTCGTDRIAQDGSRNGSIKFKCKNEECETKYFYLDAFVKNRHTDIKKTVALSLMQDGFPQRFVAHICGVHPTTIKNWESEYHNCVLD